MYLRPSRNYLRADFYDRSGMQFKRNDGNFEVTWVRKGAPAAAAGMIKGDMISAINGRRAASLDELPMRQLLSNREPYTLDILRNGREEQVLLDLRSN
jgi:S1-C subfamily serine protease